MDDNPNIERKSKTQLKKEMTALQELGEALTRCTRKQLDKLDLPELLQTSIDDFNRLPNSYGARKRQAQYIGRVMRECDHEAIKTALTRLEHEGNTASTKTNIKQSFDRLCDALLASTDQQINSLLSRHPNLERQKLRQLCRDCNKAKPERQQVLRNKIVGYLREEIGDKEFSDEEREE